MIHHKVITEQLEQILNSKEGATAVIKIEVPLF